MQACDLKSAVSEHAKNIGHSINWASVKIIGQENHLLSCKVHKAINIHTQQLEMTVIRATTFPHFMEQFCSLIHSKQACE